MPQAPYPGATTSVEEWRPVVGFEGYYEVSSEGRVRSVDRVLSTPTGPQRHRGRLLTQRLHSRGYLQASLSKDGRTSVLLIHRLVLLAFRGEHAAEARHLNGNKTDNRLVNLAWGSSKENAADRRHHGTQHRGSRTGGAKLTEADIPKIRERLAMGHRHTDIARDFAVSSASISGIARGVTWRHA